MHARKSSAYRPARRPGPLAADTGSGFVRFFLPAFLAALLTTAGLAWESWHAREPSHTDAAITRLSF
jgi:hypothetical protein